MDPPAEDRVAWKRQQTPASLSAARNALLTEWERFFRELGRIELAEILLAEMRFVAELKALAISEAQQKDLKAEAARRMAEATSARKTSAEQSGSGPVTSVSTPAR